jgi:hypothetical protein
MTFALMATDTGRARIAQTLADHIAALAASTVGEGDTLVTLQPHNNRALHDAAIALRSQEWQTVLALLAYMLPLAPGLLATLAQGCSNEAEIHAFYDKYDTHIMGSMERGVGRHRSHILLPALHPIEFIGKVLTLANAASTLQKGTARAY